MPTVEPGLGVLVHGARALLRGLRVGLLAHQASVDHRLRHAALLLGDMRGVRLARLFAPEHGLWGSAQDHAPVAATRDPATGLSVSNEAYDTVGGWVLDLFGRIPHKGEKTEAPAVAVTVEKVERTRVVEVLVRLRVTPDRPEAG